MKSIKQIAEEIGVSKTAVNKKIDQLKIRNRLSKIGNKWLIDETIENTIKNAFIDNTKTETNSETVSDIVSVLKEQLLIKDKQIEQLQTLLDQEQKLRMVTEQKLLAMEETEAPAEPKKGFWARLFS